MCVLVEAAGPAAHSAMIYARGIEQLEKAMLAEFGSEDPLLKEITCPLDHRWAPGIYFRTISMPAGSLIVGCEHLTEHLNLVWKGSAQVMINGVIEEIVAPQVFVSKPGVRKVLLIREDCVWSTIHANPDDCRDLEELERRFVVKTDIVKSREQ